MKGLSLKLFAIVIFFLELSTSCSNHNNYDFFTMSESGNMLFYKIIDNEAHVVPELQKFSKDNFTWYNNPPIGTLIIPETVTYKEHTYVVTEIEDLSFCGCKIRDFSLPITLKKIDPFAFANCQNITNIYIPDNVTEIGDHAFECCSDLKSVKVGSSIEIIGVLAFQSCKSIEEIIVNDRNKVFDSRENCNGIVRTVDNTLIIGCKNTYIPSSVENIGEYAFYNGLPGTIKDKVNDLPIIKAPVLEGWR